MSRRGSMRRGFSLLEVMIALAILSLSLGMLMTGNIAAIARVERIEGMTHATLLARAKLLDLERELNKEGFKLDDEERDGDFDDEKHPEIKWKARILPVKIQTDKLLEMVSQLAGGGDDKDGGGGSAGPLAGLTGGADPLGMFAPMITPMAQGISENMRLVVLDVEWPEGKHKGKLSVAAMVTSKALKQSNPQAGQQGNIPPIPGVPGFPGTAPTGGVTPAIPGLR